MTDRKTTPQETTGCILDASVALDYHGTGNLSVLGMYSAYVQRLCVTDFTPEEDARELTREDCDTHGIEIIVTTNQQRAEAAFMNSQSVLSMYDALNWVVARDLGLTLITNDKPLWEKAHHTGVPFLRGLRLLVILVEQRRLGIEAARRIGRQIVTKNGYLPNQILQHFLSALNSAMTEAEACDGSIRGQIERPLRGSTRKGR